MWRGGGCGEEEGEFTLALLEVKNEFGVDVALNFAVTARSRNRPKSLPKIGCNAHQAPVMFARSTFATAPLTRCQFSTCAAYSTRPFLLNA